ncbi:hypothetical protein [Agaribacterium haliotis]|uniref:hypothetical protein n=1 Tax=Agaribacterium haliotis TaxID=2013869 RepID=UPI000BB57204|nr:hypothetical protein [Agaribacterium haliotis]
MKYLPFILALTLAACAKNSEPTAPVTLVELYIDDGALQCEQPPRSLEQSKALLTQQKIQVGAARCARIDGMVAMQCGLKDLNVHVVSVSEDDVGKARSLGFEPMSQLSHHGQKSLIDQPCPSP